MDTRNKIANSSRVKAGDTGVPLVDCFVPGRTSQKMFQLLPHRSFRCPFITLDIKGLVGLLNFSIANTDEPNWAGVSFRKGIHRIRDDLQTFLRVFNLSKVRLGQR
jgi:hypothetical protein